MSILVTMYEELTDYISTQFAISGETVSPYEYPHNLATSRTRDDVILTRLYEEMEKGLLIPYKLFPNKNKNTSLRSPSCVPLIPKVNIEGSGV